MSASAQLYCDCLLPNRVVSVPTGAINVNAEHLTAVVQLIACACQ